MRSWEETLRRLVQEDACADSLLALERWLESRPGYAVTFGKAMQLDGRRKWACAITTPKHGTYQASSDKGMNVALTDAMVKVQHVEATEARARAEASEQQQPSGALSVGELLRAIFEPTRGKPST